MNIQRLDLPGMNDRDPKWIEIEKQNVCIHEASHSCVAFVLGRAPASIKLTIRVSEDTVLFSGAAKTSTPHGQSQATLHDFATIAAAGRIAESRHCRKLSLPDNSRMQSIGDDQNMARAAARAGWRNPEMFRKLAINRARVALAHPTVWDGVCCLAHALNAYWPTSDGAGFHARIMPGDEAEAVLRRAGVRPGILGARDLGAKVERFARRRL